MMRKLKGALLHGLITRAQEPLQFTEQPAQGKQQRRGIGNGSGQFMSALEARRWCDRPQRVRGGAAEALEVVERVRSEAATHCGSWQCQQFTDATQAGRMQRA